MVRDIGPHVPEGVHFIPGHPIAGTEFSGPESGFAELFDGRWTILTPLPGADEGAVAKLKAFWEACGAQVEIMDAGHHDLVLAVTSHVPHLIAYNIVGTVNDLERVTEKEVIKFSASGFRDFTRIAASDPTMWRDIFMNNKEAVLEILGRFTEDLASLQKAIRWGDGDKLFDLFTRTRAIRRGIVDARQDTAAPDFGRKTPSAKPVQSVIAGANQETPAPASSAKVASVKPVRRGIANAGQEVAVPGSGPKLPQSQVCTNEDGIGKRGPLDFRLRLADVAAEFQIRGGGACAPRRRAPGAVPLFGGAPGRSPAHRGWCWASTRAGAARGWRFG